MYCIGFNEEKITTTTISNENAKRKVDARTCLRCSNSFGAQKIVNLLYVQLSRTLTANMCNCTMCGIHFCGLLYVFKVFFSSPFFSHFWLKTLNQNSFQFFSSNDFRLLHFTSTILEKEPNFKLASVLGKVNQKKKVIIKTMKIVHNANAMCI